MGPGVRRDDDWRGGVFRQIRATGVSPRANNIARSHTSCRTCSGIHRSAGANSVVGGGIYADAGTSGLRAGHQGFCALRRRERGDVAPVARYGHLPSSSRRKSGPMDTPAAMMRVPPATPQPWVPA
jgi:hypothetical protein